MAAATGISIVQKDASFRGVFDDIFVVIFTVDSGAIQPNASAEDTIAVPGVRRATDIVLGWTALTEPVPDIVCEMHTSDDVLHLVKHNNSGGGIDPASVTYRAVIARIL